MAKNNFVKKISKIIFLATVCLLCFVMFFVTACSDTTSETKTNPTYNFSDTDDGVISNADFSYGQANVEYKNLPSSSVTGWSTATADNSAAKSDVGSGVINTNDTAWEQLLKTLYKNTSVVNYLKRTYPTFTDDYVNSQITYENETEKEEKFYEYVKEHYLGVSFVNPGKNTESTAKETNVYMLNNYLGQTELGSAQKITSSSTVQVKAGTIGKLSVWVKTANLKTTINMDGDYGANIRLVNTFNSSTQSEVRISNIRDTEWTKYTIYVKADSRYDCTFTLVLGLGYGSGSSTNYLLHTEGTAYFDDISYETVDAVSEPVDNTFNMVYADDTVKDVSAAANPNTGLKVLYDMSFKNSIPVGYFDEVDFPALPAGEENDNYYYTSSTTDSGNQPIKGKTEGTTVALSIDDADADVYPYSDKILKMTIDKAAYTVKLDNGGNNFRVDFEKYYLLTFYVRISADNLRSSDMSFCLHDVLKDETTDAVLYDVKRTVSSTVSDTDGEWSEVTFLVKNNFADMTKSKGYREFYLEILVGPTNILTVTQDYQYASGTVEMTKPKIKTAEVPESSDDAYELYYLFTNSADNFSLYAGYKHENAYEEDADTSSYSFAPSNSLTGEIVSAPTNVDNFKGIVYDHIYVSNQGTETKVNTRSGAGDNGSYAGLINTKYLANYTIGAQIRTALSFNDGDENIQPLMIYNNASESYGFVGNSNTVSKGAYAKVTVTLKVVGAQAKAYVYLVDTSNLNKEVLTFADFTVNTDTYNAKKGTAVNGSLLTFQLEVTEETSSASNDGWVTLTYYIATGTEEKNFRVEIWNGDRTGTNKSEGFVFVKDVTVATSNGFTEVSRWADMFSSGTLAGMTFDGANDSIYTYVRELSDTEKSYNKDYPDSKISYSPSFVWAKNDNTVYAVYNTVEPIETDPYPENTDDDNAGCAANTDSSTFWLSFSSILLGAALALAIIALIVKNVIRQRKASANDAKSHYKVTSRIKSSKAAKQQVKENKTESAEEEVTEETYTESVKDVEQEDDNTQEEVSDDYVYGEVQNFGNEETVIDVPEDNANENTDENK